MTESNWPENSASHVELLQRWSKMVGEATNLAQTASAVCALVQEGANVEAVAVRLRRGDEFPIVEWRGFPPGFVAVESSLCRRDALGAPVRDECGNPTWDCLCGEVLGNHCDCGLPCFTEYGTYWTNAAENMAEDAAAIVGVDWPRPACLGAGYRSIALIPLRAGGKAFGLLQCHDRRPGRFTPAQIVALENLAATAAYAFGYLELCETLQNEPPPGKTPPKASGDREPRGQGPAAAEPHRDDEETSPSRRGDFHWNRGRLGRTRRLASAGTWAAGVAHEINNPLAAIALYASVALRSMDDPDRRTMIEDAVRNIEAQALRCGQIVKSVLQFAQRERLQRWPIDLRPIAHRACELVQDLAQRQKVLVVLTRGEQPANLIANPTEIEQALVHLLTNAIQASPADGRVRLRVDPQHDGLRVTVEDRGHGMNPEQIERMFDPFYTTRQREGAIGMGLSIVYGIVENHGGEIDVQSSPGKGTTISIHLPQDVPSEGKALSMTKIFIVDDAAAYRDSLHRLLSLCGFEVAAAGGGPETAALVADFRPDVLLLDWRPDDRGDALRWIEQMRQGGADFPVVVASGYPCSRRESRLAGLTHVFRLTKPYSASALLATIETATGCPMPEPATRAPARRN